MGSPCYSGTVSALKMVVGFWFPGISVMREAPLLRKDTALLSSLFWVLGECLLRDYPDFMVSAVSSFNKPPPFHSMESFKGMPPVRDIKILTKVRTPILRQVQNMQSSGNIMEEVATSHNHKNRTYRLQQK
ncbi:hypothetical protein NC653_023143 [Populus alba x Populus x berolinensis]|uniref:Uncharacterized protein n=1 Tax=Populus alba x Populus x berolinensis TaxID=444605 RepID=A0AAD6MGG7_9ROSI|nr:hypothetical protein NC653_023143 [Populus alba x Populus x berolinensis]